MAGKTVSTIIRIVATVVLGIFLVLQIISMVTAKNGSGQLDDYPVLLFEVASDSMYPVCHTGDGLLEIRTDYSDLKEGDLITFFQNGELVSHEIQSINEDGTVTTRSRATGVEDAPISESDYIGRSILVLPGFSKVFSTTEGAWRKVAWIALILFVFWGRELMLRVAKIWKKTREGSFSRYGLKTMVCLNLIVLLFTVPTLTQAQYKWTLNGYAIVQAKEFYFTSNLLKADDNGYRETTGWDGSTMPLSTLTIRNYENSLLSNKTGEDVKYTLTWDIETYNENNEKQIGANAYTISNVTVTRADADEVIQAAGATGIDLENHTYTGFIKGNDTPKTDSFEFSLGLPQNGAAGEGSYIKIIIKANTGIGSTNTGEYAQTLQGTFEYKITSVDGFVKKFDVEDNKDSRDLTLSFGTGSLPDSQGQAQSVVIWWDTDCLEINPLNSTYVKMMQAGQFTPETTLTVNGMTKTYAKLRVTGLGSDSFRDLYFYKMTYTLGSTTYDRDAKWFNNESDITNKLGKGVAPFSTGGLFDASGNETGKILGYYFETSINNSDSSDGSGILEE